MDQKEKPGHYALITEVKKKRDRLIKSTLISTTTGVNLGVIPNKIKVKYKPNLNAWVIITHSILGLAYTFYTADELRKIADKLDEFNNEK